MLHPTAKSNMAGTQPLRGTKLSKATLPAPYEHQHQQRSSHHHSGYQRSSHQRSQQINQQINLQIEASENVEKRRAANSDNRRSLPQNFLLKRLNIVYWQRWIRYVYVRFLRMRSSPRAIARGAAAGAFAGAFPLLGLQSLVGIAIASCLRGNKVVAVASTWISNPLTYVPLFALNFHIGRLLLRLPPTEMPSSAVGIDVWMSMGMDVGAALMLGSLITGVVLSAISYYVGLRVAEKVQARKYRRKP